ncbi:kazal-type serine protease inhibitor domain, partial [Nannochloropsis oceanica]
QQ